jgi:hypothetical protein
MVFSFSAVNQQQGKEDGLTWGVLQRPFLSAERRVRMWTVRRQGFQPLPSSHILAFSQEKFQWLLVQSFKNFPFALGFSLSHLF